MLLVCCLLLLSLFVWVLCWALFCYAMSFLICFDGEEERASCFTLYVYLKYFDCCKCSMALPRGVVGRYAVCDCRIFWPYSLTVSYFISALIDREVLSLG